MKKIILLSLLVLVSSCGNNTQPEVRSPVPQEPAQVLKSTPSQVVADYPSTTTGATTFDANTPVPTSTQSEVIQKSNRP